MADDSILKYNSEDIHFQEEAKKQIEKLRANAQKETTEAYAAAHKNHCFRCGTHSLVEVEQGNVHVDICVNEGCGAVHLDPGELEKLLEGERSAFGKIKKSVFSVFK
ncbi:MAG: zf-TFIIB domain-containing protein [Desulfobacterales bacterium]